MADGEAHGNLLRAGIHGSDIRNIHHNGLIPYMAQGEVRKVEMNTLHKHIGSQKKTFVATRVNNGRIIADSCERTRISYRSSAMDPIDKAKFSQLADFYPVCTHFC